MVDRQQESIWPLTLPQIEATVSAHLGPGRVPGNEHGPCFSRQIPMYLAKHVGGWSTPQIGRFYNGRHHTTVIHAIEKIERLRTSDETVDALVEVLTATLGSDHARIPETGRAVWTETILNAVAERVISRLSGHERDSSAVASHVAKRCTLEEGDQMPASRHLTLETVNFGNTKEVDAFLEQVMNEGMRRVRAAGAELQMKGLMDADGKLLVTELPPDMHEGSDRDFGG